MITALCFIAGAACFLSAGLNLSMGNYLIATGLIFAGTLNFAVAIARHTARVRGRK